MRKTVGFLIVFLFAILTIVANSFGDETSVSHVAHLSAVHGPQITCTTSCHVDPYAGQFLDGQDLADTDVCNTCHSNEGAFDGVAMAKANWQTGVYSGSELAPGLERWCVGCHDEIPSEVNGVSAPNISGDDTTYGYYQTGHGKHGNQQAISCTDCHDASVAHVDGEPRTYHRWQDPYYQAGYRLKSVDGEEPMLIPRWGPTTADHFRLCFSCHDSAPFLTRENTNTNFRRDVDDSCVPLLDPASDLVNMHWYHLQSAVSGTAFKKWDSDWDGNIDSWMSCPACHNVHGPKLTEGPDITNAPGMIRTGELIGRSRALNLDYFADSCYGRTLSATNEVSGSTGGEMRFYWPGRGSVAKNGVCLMCHNEREPYWREAKNIVGCGSLSCHTSGSHVVHVLPTAEGGMLGIDCEQCHYTDNFPLFSDGQDLTNTTACDTCHSADGAPLAKNYWPNPGSSSGSAGSWAVVEGEASFCGSCHDGTPGYNDAAAAFNVIGDNSTYGFYATGHGKNSGNYTALSWQDSLAAGNPGANQPCGACHDLLSRHFAPSISRLKTGYENDQYNSNCNQCHPSGSNDTATADPQWYTVSADYENSAHGGKLCTDCHEVHGATSGQTAEVQYPGMTKGSQETLCYQCHTDGMIRNVSISGEKGSHNGANNAAVLTDSTQAWTDNELVGKTILNITDDSSGAITANTATTITVSLGGGTDNDWDSNDTYVYHLVADDIQEAFGLEEKHDLDTAFEVGGNNYTLQCVSCHNVHVITGPYWQAEVDKTPVSRFPPGDPDNLQPWGDEIGEKMYDYADTGTYRTPKSDPFDGSQLPDYNTFCLDCHADSDGHSNFGISWTGDMHGKRSADAPGGGGVCPDWYGCGKAEGWDGDDCVAADPADCWPVTTRGKGDQLFSRKSYNHDERIAGANFTLACSDCHEAHGSSESSMLRSNPNGGTGTWVWNTMCNNCHYYYSDWHAGMSCGTASCHVANSIHRMSAAGSTGGTRTFDPDLVVHYAFENNLNDSGDWRMHGKWMDDIAGSYAPGKSGQAIVLDGGKNVQVGTRNEYWSTDAGRHGTHIYTEMKFNTTLEAWVYPTDDANNEYSIFTKHVGYNSGGYAFTLQKVGGTLRAAFNVQIDNNGTAQDGMAGVRGAYSSVAVPLNTWTHVAATFDTGGADRDDNDPTVGRIRIYVNGEDVTTSDGSGNYLQPGADETSIFAYPENSPWNESICYDNHWCTGEFSVGGFYGWQNEFIGRIDEAKVWNVTKDTAYFETTDQNSAPFISSVKGLIGNNELTVTFSEEVYTSTGGTGALVAADFVLVDTNGDNPRTITGVTHTAGESTATITMDQPLIVADVDVDTMAAVTASIYDEHDNPASTTAVTISLIDQCSISPVSIQLNDAPGSSFIMDSQNILYGAVIGTGTLTGTEFSGDGINNYIEFEYNSTCLQASTAMTIEARIKPTGLEGTADYIKRILARDAGGNYQISVWRNNSFENYNAPTDTASIALWVNVVDNHGGNNWKVVLSDYDACPIVSDHWYQVKAEWNTNKAGGTPGQFFVPADIFIDDQGTDGLDANENWSGSANCTNATQSYKSADAAKLYTGDEITTTNGALTIGANVNNHANNVFEGLIDWITWKDSVD